MEIWFLLCVQFQLSHVESCSSAVLTYCLFSIHFFILDTAKLVIQETRYNLPDRHLLQMVCLWQPYAICILAKRYMTFYLPATVQ